MVPVRLHFRMKLRQLNLTKEQLNNIDFLSKTTGLLYETVTVLYNRGYTDKEKIQRFLNPGKQNFNSPFLLSGMYDAVERLTLARDNGETIVIYGDYDVDGICSTTILYNSLKEFGLTVYAVIPERINGYGLTDGVIEQVVETYCPDLIVTVDCGIGGHKEVEYLKDLGVDVIVTDHHEIPEILPDCITINCKLKGQDYPFDSLCGAGVAYKLASAIIGESADNYLDLVALATVADSMPLVGENRDIVVEGLNLIKNNKSSLALKSLMVISGMKDITSTSLAYSVAPRVNAAGRMGDAYSALKLFTSSSMKEIDDLTIKLNTYNIQRQSECEYLYSSAKDALLKEGNYGNVIVLYGDSWNNGLLGITSAKIAEEYYLPTIIVSGNGDVCHGSARSIDGINIYEAINACKDELIDFGGHSQAAGITVAKENIVPFAKKLNEYIKANYPQSVFERAIDIDGFVSEKFSMRLGRELDLLEPYGVGNKKPVFAVDIKMANAYPIKLGSKHIAFTSDIMDFMWFNGLSDIDLLNSNLSKTLIFEPALSTFNGRQYLKGYVKNCLINDDFTDDLVEKSLSVYLNNLKNIESENSNKLTNSEIEKLLEELNPNGFGTLLVLNNPLNYYKFKGLNAFEKCIFNLSVKGGKNALVMAVDNSTLNAKEYSKIISLDGYFALNNDKSVYYNGEATPFNFKGVTLSRDVFGSVYKEILKWVNSNEKGFDFILEKLTQNYAKEQVILAIEVFKELGFISVNNSIEIKVGVKKDLSQSVIYTKAKNLIEGYDYE